MIKFVNSMVVFEEIPNEITLAVNISNCQFHCDGCHSSYLRENIGHELNFKAIDELIEKNDGITCFCFMGEGNDPKALMNDILYIKEKYPHIKIGLYSGNNEPTYLKCNAHTNGNVDFMDSVTYYKIGPYIEEFGPLNKRTTNQKMFKITKTGEYQWDVDDITEIFWSKGKQQE